MNNLINQPDDIILYIWSFLESNEESINFLKTCKVMKQIGYENGFVKEINFNINDDIQEFMNLNYRHRKSLIKSTVSCLANPFLYLSHTKYLELTLINSFDDKICPNECLDVKKLKLLDNGRYKIDKIIVDWSKFPKLERLDVDCYDICMDGIQNCKNLKIVSITKGI